LLITYFFFAFWGPLGRWTQKWLLIARSGDRGVEFIDENGGGGWLKNRRLPHGSGSAEAPGLEPARAAGVGLATLQRIEQSEGVVKGNFATVLKIKTLQNKAGIHFTDDEAGEIGVCLSAT
jgi:hypothetical protein